MVYGNGMEIVCILDNVRSVHNVGSIFRTADAAHVSKLYLTGITPKPHDRLGIVREPFRKVALGAEKSVVWEKVPSASRLITNLRKNGFLIISAEQSSRSENYRAYAKKVKPKKIAIIFGNEVSGVPVSILKKSDRVVEIPMRGKKESLNIAVAFGIIVFEFQNYA
ncbi:MAG: TrmH family RNA methyltransferase [Patescibacteria group bacterium]